MEPAELAARLHTVSQIADVVQAMRTVAAARQRQAEESFAGLERYAAAATAALGQGLVLLAPGSAPYPREANPGPRLVIAFLSEHGFVGPLNDQILDLALRTAREGPGAAAIRGVGSRGRRLAAERGVAVEDGGPMPTTAAAVGPTADRITRAVFDAIGAGTFACVDLVFAGRAAAAAWTPRKARLFPPEVPAAEVTAGSERPLTTLPAPALVARLIEEHAFAQVTWAVGEAFACEHAARFAAMEASRRSLADKIDELKRALRTSRQEAITSEVIEVAAGAETGREVGG